MAYTRHGHHIPGTKRTEPPTKVVMSCGGPRKCVSCTTDMTRELSK